MSVLAHSMEFDSICRTCLSKDPNMKSVFDVVSNSGENPKLSQMLMACTSVQVAEDDGLPLQICLACIDCITRSFAFKARCENSDCTLREALRNSLKTDGHFIELKPPPDAAMYLQETVAHSRDCLDIKMEFDEENSTFADRISHSEHRDADDLEPETIESASDYVYETLPDAIKDGPVHDQQHLQTNTLVNDNESSIQPVSDESEESTIESDLMVHSLAHEQSKTTIFKCRLCDKEYTSSRRLANHMPVHDCATPQLCNVCGKDFQLPGELRKHARTAHTVEKPYACTLCDKRFARAFSLTEHMRAHANEKLFACVTCGVRFSRRNALSKHQRTHIGVRKHVCTICGEKFLYPRPLALHMNTHTGVKVHVCPYCDKGFTTIHYLEAHKRSHTDEELYFCNACDRGFATVSQLKPHLRVHTISERRPQCHLCAKTFACAEDLRNHIKIHTIKRHADDPSPPKLTKRSKVPEIPQVADSTDANLLPNKSRPIYERNYQKFEDWCKEKKIDAITENVLLDYFQLQKEQYKASTVWATYSMLRSCLNIYKNIDISKYSKLQTFLKQAAKGYAPTKSKCLDEEHIQRFIETADDDTYLAMKVILIMGFNGADLSREEITYMSVDDIEYAADSIIVTIPRRNNNRARTFTITHAHWIAIIRKYASLRPENVAHERFLLTYRNGRCVQQPIGVNIVAKVWKHIATFLQLPTPELFTGCCVKRANGAGVAQPRSRRTKPLAVTDECVDASLTPKIEVDDTFEMSACTNFDVPECSSASEMQFNAVMVKSEPLEMD